MSNIIVEFIKAIPGLVEMFLPLVPLVVLGLIGICMLICYFEYRSTKESSFPFWKFAYYWWTELLFGKKKNTD